MTFWLLATALSLLAAATLYAAAGARAGLAGPDGALEANFRARLREIEADIAGGRLAPPEGLVARGELARELLRQRRDAAAYPSSPRPLPLPVIPGAIVATLAIAFLAYAGLGSPGLPSQPFAGRPEAQVAPQMTVDDAIKAVEARLAQQPDDLRGWQVIAPVYMQAGRYADAEHAFRQVLRLSPPTADSDTDLAEALIEENGGAVTPEARDLLTRAAAMDPTHVRSRFYLAADAMRQKDYAGAVARWKAIIALGKGDENWMPTAQSGLATAEAGLAGKPLPDDGMAAPTAIPAGDANSPAPNAAAMPVPGSVPAGGAPPAILSMVQGLSDRLNSGGGSLDDWTQLVRSEIVLGEMDKAQAAYDAARKAYPDATERADLDTLAAQAGLKLDGTAR